MLTASLQKVIVVSMTIMLFSGGACFALSDDRTIEKTRNAVKNASPNDWYTLAISAEKCFHKKVNIEEAVLWLDQSLEIAETPFNLELKADYYVEIKLHDKALEYYVRTMNALKAKDGEAEISHIQKKISEIIKITG